MSPNLSRSILKKPTFAERTAKPSGVVNRQRTRKHVTFADVPSTSESQPRHFSHSYAPSKNASPPRRKPSQQQPVMQHPREMPINGRPSYALIYEPITVDISRLKLQASQPKLTRQTSHYSDKSLSPCHPFAHELNASPHPLHHVPFAHHQPYRRFQWLFLIHPNAMYICLIVYNLCIPSYKTTMYAGEHGNSILSNNLYLP